PGTGVGAHTEVDRLADVEGREVGDGGRVVHHGDAAVLRLAFLPLVDLVSLHTDGAAGDVLLHRLPADGDLGPRLPQLVEVGRGGQQHALRGGRDARVRIGLAASGLPDTAGERGHQPVPADVPLDVAVVEYQVPGQSVGVLRDRKSVVQGKSGARAS